MSTVSPRAATRPTQYYYDSATGRIDVVVDVSPAERDDLTVLVGDDRLELRIDGPDGPDERAFRTPSADWAFGDDHDAIYNNGVLTISVETEADDVESID